MAIADFNGDGKPDAVTPGGVLLNIGAPDFSLYLGSVTPNPIPGGRSGQGAVTVGSDNRFDGSISLTCSVQPATAMAPTCSLSPTSTQVSPGESLNSTLTISTTSSTSSLISPADRRPEAWQSFLMGLPVAGLALIGVGSISRRSRKEQVWAFALASIALSTLAFQMACGGGNTSHGTTGTPPGTYNVTINGSSGSIQHTTTLSITVQ